MHELYMDTEMYREKVADLEEWIVSICHSEGMNVPEEAVSKERVKEIESKYPRSS